jgi:hypothetical protein
MIESQTHVPVDPYARRDTRHHFEDISRFHAFFSAIDEVEWKCTATCNNGEARCS